MLEKGVPLSVVADIMGWSASTMAKMAKRYGHIGNQARRDAINALSSATTWDVEGAQIWAQSTGDESGKVQQVLEKNGSSGRTRTYNPPVNSRMLCHVPTVYRRRFLDQAGEILTPPTRPFQVVPEFQHLQPF